MHDVLGDQRDTGRAVQEDDVVVVSDAAQQLAKTPGPLLRVVELKVHVAVAEVGGQQVQVVEVGCLQCCFDRASTTHQGVTAAFDPRSHTEYVGGGGLRIEVPQQGPPAFTCGEVGQVHRRRRFPDSTLDVVRREDLHRASWSRCMGWPLVVRWKRANATSNSRRALSCLESR